MSYDGPPPASAAWREGDPVGHRLFANVGDVVTESGVVVPNVRVAYETWGVLNTDRSNAIYVCHALTGDSHVTGPAGPGHKTAGWWDGLVGPGRAIDTDEWFVVCANVLGGCQGTTGASSTAPDGRPWGSRFPVVTVADMVEVERRLSDLLGIQAWALMFGPSLGGMRVLEWLVRHPDRLRGALLLGTTAAVTADQIGTHATQLAAIEADPAFCGGDYYDASPGNGPHVGMGIARRIAHLTYRCDTELNLRFGRDLQEGEDPYAGGRFAVESYLDHHADKLSRRFDANTYVALTRSMSLFDIGRGRGGVANALADVTVPVTVIGIDSDRLFPVRLQQELVDLTPGAEELHLIHSPYGHDGFLVENDQVAAFARLALDRVYRNDQR
ncbi:MAG: homoserine O-acetyltransferase [bacterium]|nr:homoserine O-acetyltransferase [bacterium]